MNKEKCKTKTSKAKRISVTIRITKDLSTWLKNENLSPTGIFEEATKELGYKEV